VNQNSLLPKTFHTCLLGMNCSSGCAHYIGRSMHETMQMKGMLHLIYLF